MNNMKTAVKTLCSAAALLTLAQAPAQEPARTLTLDEAIAMTLTDNPAVKAAEYEERAAQQQRRASIGLRMPRINVTGAYAYMAKDIGVDFNDMKAPVQDIAGQVLGSGMVPPQYIPQIQQLIAPIMGADWFLKVQDRSLGFVGGQVTMPIWLGGKINAAGRAAKIQEQTAIEQGVQTRNALVSELVERYFGLALAMQVVEVRQQVVEGAALLPQVHPRQPCRPQYLTEDPQGLQRRQPGPGFPRPDAVRRVAGALRQCLLGQTGTQTRPLQCVPLILVHGAASFFRGIMGLAGRFAAKELVDGAVEQIRHFR